MGNKRGPGSETTRRGPDLGGEYPAQILLEILWRMFSTRFCGECFPCEGLLLHVLVAILKKFHKTSFSKKSKELH